MTLSATTAYGISISLPDVKKAGFLTLDNLADAIVDELPFMTRISNGDIEAGEYFLVMAVEGTVVTAYDSAATFSELPAVNDEQKQALEVFMEKNLPGHKAGFVLSAFEGWLPDGSSYTFS